MRCCTRDATQAEGILGATSESALVALMGEDTYWHAAHLAETLLPEDRDALLGIFDDA